MFFIGSWHYRNFLDKNYFQRLLTVRHTHKHIRIHACVHTCTRAHIHTTHVPEDLEKDFSSFSGTRVGLYPLLAHINDRLLLIHYDCILEKYRSTASRKLTSN